MSTPCSSDGPEDEAPMVLFDRLEHAFLGTVQRFGQPAIACYDYDAVLAGYVADGLSYEDAQEFFEYNVLGAWVGDTTPCFLSRTTLDELRAQLGD